MNSHSPQSRDNNLGLRLVKATDRLLNHIEKPLTSASSFLLIVMMVLVSADALMRYLMNQPLGFTNDLVVLVVMPAAMFFALSYTFRRGGHVGVEVVALMLPKRLFEFLFGLGLLCLAVILFAIAREGAKAVHEAWIYNEDTGGAYPIPYWLIKASVPIGFGVFALRALHAAFANLVGALTAHPTIAYPALVNHYEDEENGSHA